MAFSGSGAGPARAGSAGGPSRFFLGAALLFSVVVAAILAARGRWPSAAGCLAAAVYFTLRLLHGLGRRR
jgi:hypothetical protein